MTETADAPALVETVEQVEPAELPHPEVLAVPADLRGDLDLARLVARALLGAARTLGIPPEGLAFDDLCREVYGAAVANPRNCPLDSATFKAVWEIREVITPRSAAVPVVSR